MPSFETRLNKTSFTHSLPTLFRKRIHRCRARGDPITLDFEAFHQKQITSSNYEKIPTPLRDKIIKRKYEAIQKALYYKLVSIGAKGCPDLSIYYHRVEDEYTSDGTSPGYTEVSVTYTGVIVFEAYGAEPKIYIPGKWEDKIEKWHLEAQALEAESNKRAQNAKEAQAKKDLDREAAKWGLSST